MSFTNPELTLGTRDFSPGFLDTPEPDTLPPGASPDAKNAFFYGVEAGPEQRRARMGRRRGCRLVNPSAIASTKKIDGLWEFRRESSAGQLLAACNGAWYAFDEINAFAALAGATGYNAGASARISPTFKNQTVLHDGSNQQIYDGSSVRGIGFSKPTGLTNMSAAAGPGVTGTYSARYTWYDQNHDHESSPVVGQTANLVLANQQRTHTKPSGAPPAQVTHWRAYVRREDTSEIYWMRVATVAIASATVTEAVIDTARVDRLPLEAENEPPAVTFSILGVFNGYAIGFEQDKSTMHVSKQGDIESWDPNNRFKVDAGDGRPVRSAKNFGTEFLIQKPHASWHLVGTRLPFDIEPLQGSFGNVSQEAGLEVAGRFFGWDEIKGPYWTDIGPNWVSIADFTIENVLATVNRQALQDIRAVHDETRNLIIWAVPTIGSTRKRTLLAYHYKLGVWLPPITGMEYGSLVQYTTNSGQLSVYFGDYWGRVYELWQNDRDGLPTNPSTLTISGTVKSATSSTLTDGTANFYTTGDGMAGMPIAVRSPAGVWQWRRIQSNTATVITLDTTNANPWTTVPLAGWTYILCGIEWYWTTPILDGGQPARQKRGHWLELQQTPAAGTFTIDLLARFGTTTDDLSLSYQTQAAGALWGVGIWGVSLWAGGIAVRPFSKLRLKRSFFSVQFRFSNYYPDQRVELTAYQVGCDILSRRSVRGAA